LDVLNAIIGFGVLVRVGKIPENKGVGIFLRRELGKKKKKNEKESKKKKKKKKSQFSTRGQGPERKTHPETAKKRGGTNFFDVKWMNILFTIHVQKKTGSQVLLLGFFSRFDRPFFCLFFGFCSQN
jgi:hypothetical protein